MSSPAGPSRKAGSRWVVVLVRLRPPIAVWVELPRRRRLRRGQLERRPGRGGRMGGRGHHGRAGAGRARPALRTVLQSREVSKSCMFKQRMHVVVVSCTCGATHTAWALRRARWVSVPASSGGPSPAAAAGGGSPCGGAGASVVVPERSFTMVLDNVTLDTRSAVDYRN